MKLGACFFCWQLKWQFRVWPNSLLWNFGRFLENMKLSAMQPDLIIMNSVWEPGSYPSRLEKQYCRRTIISNQKSTGPSWPSCFAWSGSLGRFSHFRWFPCQALNWVTFSKSMYVTRVPVLAYPQKNVMRRSALPWTLQHPRLLKEAHREYYGIIKFQNFWYNVTIQIPRFVPSI